MLQFMGLHRVGDGGQGTAPPGLSRMEEGREGSGLGRGRPQAVTPHTRPLRLLPPTAASRQSCPGVSGVGAQARGQAHL